MKRYLIFAFLFLLLWKTGWGQEERTFVKEDFSPFFAVQSLPFSSGENWVYSNAALEGHYFYIYTPARAYVGLSVVTPWLFWKHFDEPGIHLTGGLSFITFGNFSFGGQLKTGIISWLDIPGYPNKGSEGRILEKNITGNPTSFPVFSNPEDPYIRPGMALAWHKNAWTISMNAHYYVMLQEKNSLWPGGFLWEGGLSYSPDNLTFLVESRLYALLPERNYFLTGTGWRVASSFRLEGGIIWHGNNAVAWKTQVFGDIYANPYLGLKWSLWNTDK